MKKTLLLTAAIVAAMSVSAQDEGTDVTPANYHFNTATKIPWFDNKTADSNDQGAGIAFKGGNYKAANGGVWESFNGDADTWWDGGLIGIVSSNGLNDAQWNNLKGGMNLVNIGGEVGQVMAWVGKDSDLKAQLEENYPDKDWSNIVNAPGPVGGWNFNFFLDPKDIHCKGQGYYRFRMVVNVLHTATAADENNGIYRFSAEKVFNEIYQVNNQGNNASYLDGKDQASQDPNLGLSLLNNLCIQRTSSGAPKEDGNGDYIWDPTQWIVYDYYFNVAGNNQGKDDSGDSTVPVRIKMIVNGGGKWDRLAVLFKDISITKFSGQLPSTLYNSVKGGASTMVTLDPAAPTGLNDIFADKTGADEPSYSINGNTITFSAPAAVYNLVGQKVAEGTSAVLGSGVYVAKVGAKSVKFVIR